jgi:hypothetical protein
MIMHDARPFVGQIVHYVANVTPRGEHKAECRAAIVTAVHEDPDPSDPTTVMLGETRRMGEVDLCVLSRDDMSFIHAVPQNEPLRGDGTWHWPEREDS